MVVWDPKIRFKNWNWFFVGFHRQEINFFVRLCVEVEFVGTK